MPNFLTEAKKPHNIFSSNSYWANVKDWEKCLDLKTSRTCNLAINIIVDDYDAIRDSKYFFSFPVSSSFYGTQWHEIHPQYWTKFQVWEWLQHLLDTNQLDANCIPFQEFDINGEHLCSMSLQEFTQAAGTAGQLLYSNLQHLKWNGK